MISEARRSSIRTNHHTEMTCKGSGCGAGVGDTQAHGQECNGHSGCRCQDTAPTAQPSSLLTALRSGLQLGLPGLNPGVGGAGPSGVSSCLFQLLEAPHPWLAAPSSILTASSEASPLSLPLTLLPPCYEDLVITLGSPANPESPVSQGELNNILNFILLCYIN